MKAAALPSAPAPLSIGVIADTHGVLSPAIPPLLAGVSHIIHAGDVGKRSVLRRLEAIAPVTAVSGNADSGKLAASLPSLARGEVRGVPFLVVHKPKAVKRHLPAARDQGVRLIVVGHLHEPGFRWEDGILHVNPGTATAPEEGDSQATVAIVTVLAEGLSVTFLPVPKALPPPAKTKKSGDRAGADGDQSRPPADGDEARPGDEAPQGVVHPAIEVGDAPPAAADPAIS